MTLIQGDCVEVMAGMPAESVDAIVTDPPYGLEFMGREWDKLSGQPGYNERGRMTPASSGLVKTKGFDRIPNSFQAGKPMQAWHEAWAREAFRVAKPGAHLLAFGGTRTYHRLASAIEDAGWEIRDCLVWAYASGFPKSLDVGKAMDRQRDKSPTERLSRAIGAARLARGLSLAELGRAVQAASDGQYGQWYHRGGTMFYERGKVPSRPEWAALKVVLPELAELDEEFGGLFEIGEAWDQREVIGERTRKGKPPQPMWDEDAGQAWNDTSPATDLARKWEGWGTALKPSFEPVVLGAKPLTVEQHFGILLEYLTALMEDLWFDSPATDVVSSLSVTRAKCAAVAASVLASARTYSLASIGLVPSAGLGSTSAALDSLDPTRTPGATALSHVRASSSEENEPGPTTGPGGADDISTRLMAMCTSVTMGDTEPSTALSWSAISDDLLSAANTFTIETATRLTTALRTLSWSMWQSTSDATGEPSHPRTDYRPIVMARKPLRGTVAGNVTQYGTGALNIDATRIGTNENYVEGFLGREPVTNNQVYGKGLGVANPQHPAGRWPANLILTDPIFDGDVEGVVGGGQGGGGFGVRGESSHIYGGGNGFTAATGEHVGYGDSGTYSRFFLIPKASRSDREPVVAPDGHDRSKRFSNHPTVKPVELMRHLVRLVTPPGGTVLDCFAGSGSTLLAAEMEGFAWIGIEKEPEYVAIAEARLHGTQRGLGLDVGAPTRKRSVVMNKTTERPNRSSAAQGFRGPWKGTGALADKPALDKEPEDDDDLMDYMAEEARRVALTMDVEDAISDTPEDAARMLGEAEPDDSPDAQALFDATRFDKP